jgi:PAS domain S-box-containing protein
MNPIDQKAADADIADLIARSPFSGQLRGGVALLVAAQNPPHIIFANEAAHAAFRTTSLDQLNAAAMVGTSPGARRLRQLATTPAAGAPRLERLRFFIGRLPLQLSLLCARVADAHGDVFLVAAPPDGVQAVKPATSAPSAAAPASLSPGQADGKESVARRFLWSANEDFRFETSPTALAGAIGDSAPRAAEPLAALKARTGLDENGQLAETLAKRATFSSLRVAWPRSAPQEVGKEAIVVTLSGAPVFDRERRFLGYRGFGIFTGETAPFAPAPMPGAESEPALVAPALDPPIEATLSAPAVEETPHETQPSAEDAVANPQASSERSAEIVPLRSPAQPYAGGPNVVPIRPGALRHFLSAEEGQRRDEEGDSVELTTHERDAFREIARALGAKASDHRDDRIASISTGPEAPAPAAPERPRDLIDLDAPHGAAPAPGKSEARTVVDGDASRLLDRLPIGALIARGGEALYLNRTLLDLLGYRDLAQFRANSGLARIFKGRPPEQIGAAGEGGALSLMSADGEEIAVDGQIQTIEWGGGGATLISLRRSHQAEFAPKLRALEFDARAREAEARELSTVLDTATDGIVMLDSQGRILSLNRPAEALFGYDQKEVAGENFLTLLSPESHAPIKAYFDGLQTSGLASLLNDGRDALGQERHGRAIPLFITMGRVNASPDAKFCAVLRDMTQWKTIERDLEAARGQAEKASALKSEFLAKISHEIRTPLNAILGFAEVIMDERFGPLGNERYKEYLKDIHASGAHVMSLVNDLLDLSKIEAGKHDFNFAAVDANSVIQECVSLMQPQAAQERIIMRLSLFDKLPKIIADERSLRQIMLNLMSNAVKFNEPGGQVIVSTAMNDSGQAVIRVRDTGIGMSDEELGIALEPFRQISSARQKGGTGLGLPLTKALVEANRAGISIKSRKEQGTLVEIAFPTTQAAAAQ